MSILLLTLTLASLNDPEATPPRSEPVADFSRPSPTCDVELRRANGAAWFHRPDTPMVRLERAFDVRIDGCPAPQIVRYLGPDEQAVEINRFPDRTRSDRNRSEPRD